ncbi:MULTISPECIES: RNA degradosome polyphosphate kinase [Parabacteroides]|jgi:polyphosphate kinase|uniref:RNA degradosome polyphosphate kinase n=1 Tax=Parabacteroides TaxID=375288 RepID=UPI000E9122FF|nr:MULTISPECIES: RNA degradosome polyphosphate kinase [Parabacteroides]MBP9558687.1 RNA degradosome polyphosphate kinase [Parabacteroides sp.]MCI7458978.1 RNA degradosome polyphosphate kinase [Parabacteroides merdae]MDB8963030.1 RNA degradosome polyphosphate kinase [Parabacteroides merdae]MDB8966962.1 RNA degradosome polyphosphate kinase [Parabacteroides merdae]MDB8969996.1 RNA degradosome polyphosphate kinase [Parabacteroides merdae]
MENSHKYFKRDISWLSFNYRVLLEAEDETLPIYERIKFLSIYSSNLEEFYEIRVAEHRGVIMKKNFTEESGAEAEETLAEITEEVNRQQREYYRIFSKVLQELNRQDIYLYQDSRPEPFHEEFVHNFFNEEVFPFLSPVMIQAGDIRTFIRDRRLYLVIRMVKKSKRMAEPDYVPDYYYALMKIPYAKVPRFIELPTHEGKHYIMFIDDIIRANLSSIFPGYVVESCYSIKISRDADIYLDDEKGGNIVENIRKKVKKRKIGALSRFMYDSNMPDDFLAFICNAFGITTDDLVLGGRYNNLQDLIKLPNPRGKELEQQVPSPMRVPFLDEMGSVFRAVKKRDILLHFPYQSFDYLIRFLMEAAFDPKVDEIKITQYRVAENSAVINTLISAAQNGKKVTVFVELKARFDEENNMSTAERMEQAGIRIIYSIPGLKVHAKVAVILRKDTEDGCKRRDFAYLSTGNFNEKTARIYSDMALLTSNAELITDINKVFAVLEGKLAGPTFRHLLVARFNMVPELTRMIHREIEHVKAGRKGRIVLKMNGLHDQNMINELYNASENGVEIDLIVRGICCLVPNRPFSANIRVTRIVDMFLEHSRIWYFYNDGEEDLFLTSADWMRRNLNRRIETAFPILNAEIKQCIIDILKIQLQDNVKACLIDEHLYNNFKRDDNPVKVRAQLAIYEYLKNKM